jgi:hypothetical protein
MFKALEIRKTLKDTIVRGGAQVYAYDFQKFTEVLGLTTTLFLHRTISNKIPKTTLFEGEVNL